MRFQLAQIETFCPNHYLPIIKTPSNNKNRQNNASSLPSLVSHTKFPISELETDPKQISQSEPLY